MALGNSFAALVDGFTNGAEIRHSWQDRKRKQEAEDVLAGYEAQRQERIGEAHGWDRDAHGWDGQKHGVYMDIAGDENRVRDLAWEEDEELRRAYREAAETLDYGPPTSRGLPPGPVETAATAGTPALGYGAAAPGRDGAPAQTRSDIAASPSRGLSYGAAEAELRPAMPLRDPRERQFSYGNEGQPAPTSRAAEAAQAQGQPDRPAIDDDGFLETLPGGKLVARRAPRNSEEKATLAKAARDGLLIQDEALAERQSQIDAAGTARQQRSGIAAALERDPDHRFRQDGGAAADIREAAKLPARGLVRVADAVQNQGARGIRQINAPLDAISRWITGKDTFGSPSNVNTLGDAPKMPDGKPMSREQRQASEIGAAALADAVENTPGMAEAAEAVTRNLPDGARVTPTRRAAAADTVMRSYRENGVPKVLKVMMAQGRFAEAETLRTFADDAATQEGMRAWAGSVFAAQQGDVESAVDGLMDAYNAAGYYEDGRTIDKEQTELIRAEDGEVMGIRMAIRDTRTGEVTIEEQTIPNLLEQGLWILSPEKAAENYMTRQQALREQLAAQDLALREAQGEIVTEDHKSAQTAAREAYKKLGDPLTAPRDADGNLLPVPSWPEFLDQFMGGTGADPMAAAPGEVPVMRR